VSTIAHQHGAVHAPPRRPPTGIHRFLAPGWLRALWTTPVGLGVGCGIMVLVRWLEGWHPIWDWRSR